MESRDGESGPGSVAPAPSTNSQAYWSDRFPADWIANGGREQSIFFYRLLVDSLPAWLARTMREPGWSLCDWGCALGDGTDLLAQLFPGPVTGIDFAEPAIASARATFSRPRFLQADLTREEIGETFAVVVSSNTLEHFGDPADVLARLQRLATEAVVLLVPFREYGRLPEHEATFDLSNIPAELGDGRFVLAASKVIDARRCEPSWWAGDQILLTYVRPGLLAERRIRLADVAVDHEAASPQQGIATEIALLSNRHADELATLRRRYETEDQARAGRFIDERERWNAQVSDLAAALSVARAERVDAEADRTFARRSVADLTATVETERAVARQRVDELTRSLETSEHRRDQAEAAQLRDKTDLVRLDDQLAAERISAETERRRLSEMAASADALAVEQSRHLHLAREELREARERIERLDEDIERLGGDLRSSRAERDISVAAASDLHGQVRDLTRRLEAPPVPAMREERIEEALLQARNEDISKLGTIVAARDDGIAWLRGEIHVLAGEFERRRASFRILLSDLIVLIPRRWPWLRPFGRALIPDRLRFRILARANSSPLLTLVHRTGAQPRTGAPAPDRGARRRAPVPSTSGPDRAGRFDIVCFANIDWSARYQRPQQMMSAFARSGHRVFYVVASRTPPAGQDYDAVEVAENVVEVSLQADTVQNFYGSSMSSGNRVAFTQAIAALARDRRIKTAVSIVHLAYWTPLALVLRELRGWPVQYDCMDEWNSFPNIGQDLLDDEEKLVIEADLVTVTAGLLQDKWQAEARRCLLVRNGVDYDFFQSRCRPNDLLAHLPQPIVGYYGALAEWIDFALIAAVARARPDWSIVLIGDHFVTDLAGLDVLPNVHLLGRRPYADMPLYLYWFDACLIPFRVYSVTHAVDPVKFYEYMSAGKPIVATPIAELQVYKDHLAFASDAASMVTAIESAIADSDPALAGRRRDFAKANDWTDRAETTLAAIREGFLSVSIVVVTYNNLDLTTACIDSLLRNTTQPRYEIIVVDNASTDGTRAYLQYLARSDGPVRVELNPENRGFAAANNQGLRSSTGDIVVLLNNDTLVPKGWLDPLVRHLEDRTIGLVGPVTNEIGNEAKVKVDYTDPDGMEAFADAVAARRAGQCFDIEMLAMFCVAMRREVLDAVGPLDEQFGMGLFEDDDYSRRVRQRGWRTVCAEDAFIHHVGRASFGKLPAAAYDDLWRRNHAYFEQKWGAWRPHKHRPQDA